MMKKLIKNLIILNLIGLMPWAGCAAVENADSDKPSLSREAHSMNMAGLLATLSSLQAYRSQLQNQLVGVNAQLQVVAEQINTLRWQCSAGQVDAGTCQSQLAILWGQYVQLLSAANSLQTQIDTVDAQIIEIKRLINGSAKPPSTFAT